MKNSRLFGLTLAMTGELTAFILVAYFLAKEVALAMSWDETLVMAGLLGCSFLGWLLHVTVIFKEIDDDSGSDPDITN